MHAKKKVAFRNVAVLYGERPADLKHLSPYEFVTYWEAVLCKYPMSEDAEITDYHAELTALGKQKLKDAQELQKEGERNAIADMYPGIDYVVRIPAKEENWLPFPDVPSSRAQDLRHTWVLVRRKRPVAPSFSGAPIPRHRPGESERAAKITLTYFHPWTLRLEDVEPHIPHASQLKGEHATWQMALGSWLDGGILSRESKRYVSNFLSVYRIRPTDDDEDEGNSDNLASDIELEVSQFRLISFYCTDKT